MFAFIVPTVGFARGTNKPVSLFFNLSSESMECVLMQATFTECAVFVLVVCLYSKHKLLQLV